MPGLKKRMKETWDAVFLSNIGVLKYCMLEAGFLFHEFLLLLHCSISYFQRTWSYKMPKDPGKNWMLWLKSIAYYVRRQQTSWERLLLRGQEVDFPLILDFNIDFQYLIIRKKHGFTCIFNFLKFESCMSLTLTFGSGFQSWYLKYKIHRDQNGGVVNWTVIFRNKQYLHYPFSVFSLVFIWWIQLLLKWQS